MTAVDTIRRRAIDATPRAVERLRALDLDPDRLTALFTERARLTVSFHPDRRDRLGRTVAQGLLDDGRYRSQYETGISNGGRFAVDGGPRPRWELELFGDGAASDRPAYGTLDLTRDPLGGAPRFGSSFLILHRECLRRATFCVGDSHVGPTDVGTADALAAVVAGVAEQSGGEHAASTDEFLALVEHGAVVSARSLDDYVEMQVHGGIDLSSDVEAVHLDPSFGGTETEAALAAAADRYGFDLRRHSGSELPVTRVPADFRGPEMPELARGVARTDGIVDAHAIGRALDDLPFTPPTPAGDPEDSDRQRFKRLWHCVVRFGDEAGSPGARPPIRPDRPDRPDNSYG